MIADVVQDFRHLEQLNYTLPCIHPASRGTGHSTRSPIRTPLKASEEAKVLIAPIALDVSMLDCGEGSGKAVKLSKALLRYLDSRTLSCTYLAAECHFEFIPVLPPPPPGKTKPRVQDVTG